MKKSLLSIILILLCSLNLAAQVPDSTQVPTVTPQTSTSTDTTSDETEFQSTDERQQLPAWFYSVSLDGTASSGNVNRQLLNFKTTLNFESKKSIFGFFTSPRFQYGTNSNVLQEREILMDINSTLFYAQHDVYGLLFGAFEQSNLRKISSRYNIGVGIGWKIFGGKRTPKARLKLSISNALVREVTDFVEKQDRNVFRNSTRFRGKYDIIPDKLFIQSVVFLQPSLNDNYYRWNSSTQLSYKVGKYISILASFENTYENFNSLSVQNAQTNTTIGLIYNGSN
ncbi:MAG: DUF481 domain-containing protein [Bacteroidota bacterium]|jgi:hypothetical protein